MAKKSENSPGRPRRFKTVTQLQADILAYFTRVEESPVTARVVPTISGLALALDVDKKTLHDYADREDEYSPHIKRALMIIEQFWESKLASQSCTGAIFWLKNRGWKDEQKIDHTSKGEEIKSIQYINPPATQIITAPAHGDPTTQANGQATPGLPSVGTA